MTKSLRNEIIQHLKKKGNYDPDVDDFVINILIKNIDYAEELKQRIESEGLIVTIPNGNGIATTKENPAYGTYCKCLSNIHECSAKLGIYRKDRIALKLLEEKQKDDFDSDFS
jgi:P27 family predicted phage terminase small subunit